MTISFAESLERTTIRLPDPEQFGCWLLEYRTIYDSSDGCHHLVIDRRATATRDHVIRAFFAGQDGVVCYLADDAGEVKPCTLDEYLP